MKNADDRFADFKSAFEFRLPLNGCDRPSPARAPIVASASIRRQWHSITFQALRNVWTLLHSPAVVVSAWLAPK
jgi:hypothetical protein